MDFWQFLGNLHPRLVQFPLVLLLAGLLFDLSGLISRRDWLSDAARILSAAGTFFLLFAFICGIYAEIWAARAGISQDAIEWHELMANIASWGFVILMAWRLFLTPAHRRSLSVYVAIGLFWYVLLVITGYLGGKLVFSYGAAVIGARANDALSLHDLNNLATRQTNWNLQFSELMHHIFGWLTLALSGSLFIHALFPKKADKLKWVGPMLLLLGGIFLFFFADIDLYNLLDPRQFRDREVQLHKTLSIVLMFAGGMGLRRIRHHHKASQESLNLDEPLAPGHMSTPSKIVAVMALIGGGMLFTHVHTVAPYANVAAGVYIAHVVMGLTALGIGATRLLQDSVPRYRRVLATAFAVLMCFESVLLITYNEGLPWYIGYGRYNRWGDHNIVMSTDDTGKQVPISHGTVAPYGPIRAELVFDPNNSRMDLWVTDRFGKVAEAVATSTVHVLIGRGYSDLDVTLTQDNSPPATTGPAVAATDAPLPIPGSHFSAIVPSLHGVEAFSARAALPVGSGMTMGYFDPWVTPVINPIPPNEVAKYQCPMHDGIQSQNPGVCPLCGMQLVPIIYGPRLVIHDADYEMKCTATAGPDETAPLLARRPVLLTLTPTHLGVPEGAAGLAMVHEHLMHLIIVSSDYTFFDHVHPVIQHDGSFTLSYVFPHAGTYLLYADTTPNGQRSQVFRETVTIRNSASEPMELSYPLPNLSPAAALSKPLPGDPDMTAELIFSPRVPVAGLHTNFIFRLTRNGQPVNDLEPYIGAMGHVVILSADTQMYLHCHPEQLTAPTADMRGGPDVPFHTIFPHAGMYKIWGQFKRNGKVVIADFVVNVQEPILPPRLINFLLDD